MFTINDLLYLMQRLREPQTGCPWDKKQNIQTLKPFVLEEAYELVDAIEKKNWDHIAEELGDVLFQVIFISHIAEEQNHFDFSTVVDQITRKLVRRHPHVFDDNNLYGYSKGQTDDVDQINRQWQQIKVEENQQKQQPAQSVLDSIPMALPALQKAIQLQKKIRHYEPEPSINELQEQLVVGLQQLNANESQENPDQKTLLFGQLLFAIIALVRRTGADPEMALRTANQQVEAQFRANETSRAL